MVKYAISKMYLSFVLSYALSFSKHIQTAWEKTEQDKTIDCIKRRKLYDLIANVVKKFWSLIFRAPSRRILKFLWTTMAFVQIKIVCWIHEDSSLITNHLASADDRSVKSKRCTTCRWSRAGSQLSRAEENIVTNSWWHSSCELGDKAS